MKEIKIDILNTSRILFNTYGVSNVSIRQIAKELGISHSHLIYHFSTKQDIIVSLHQQLLDHAKNLNANFQSTSNFIKDLLVSTEVGFGILYEYKFLMLELNYILKENESLKNDFILIESVRSKMYLDVINLAVQEGFLRPAEYPEEYPDFVKYIRIFSDFWISSADIYESGDHQKSIKKYAFMLVKSFYPYMTKIGKEAFVQL